MRKGGAIDISQSFLEPTLMTDIPAGSPIMEEEIFGPILPIIPYDSLETLVEHLRLKSEPWRYTYSAAIRQQSTIWAKT